MKHESSFSITGKKILIAGGASGIGAEISRRLILGKAKVLILDEIINTDISDLIRLGASESDFVQCNMSKPENIETSIRRLYETAGELNGVVFSFGIGGVRPLQITKLNFVEDMFRTNVFSFIELLKCVSKKGVLADGASIVALSSVSSFMGLKAKTAYCASKAALDSAVRAVASELGIRKIRVNSIQKGWVSYDMQHDFIQNNMALSGDADLSKQFLGIIEPSDIANSVIFLLSDASAKITGTSIVLDGGYSL